MIRYTDQKYHLKTKKQISFHIYLETEFFYNSEMTDK